LIMLVEVSMEVRNHYCVDGRCNDMLKLMML
jgi:hypothetical protein